MNFTKMRYINIDKKTGKKVVKPVNIELYKKAIVGSKGILANVARNLGVTRQAVFLYVNQHPELRKDLEADRQRVLDMVEDEVFQIASIQTSDPKVLALKLKAAEKTLSSLGAQRGWATVTEQKTTILEDTEKTNERIEKLRALPEETRNKISEVMGWNINQE